jgi:putative membrane protein
MESLRQFPNPDGQNFEEKSFILSSSRTGLSLHRTRMSADRTLMSIIRTSLSLISFGFTIFQFFRYLRQSVSAVKAVPIGAPAHFGLALVLLGNAMLLMGIFYHIKFMRELRTERMGLLRQQLVDGEIPFPISMTLMVALLLLCIGVAATLNMLLRMAH